jgi:uncharacterized protein YjiS (DUF1127 family)
MTAIDYARSDPFSATRPTLARRAVAWVSNAFRIWKNRREFYQLGEMTDVELQDIGLTRSDLAVPADLTFDPTEHLGKVARQRINRMEIAARSVS